MTHKQQSFGKKIKARVRKLRGGTTYEKTRKPGRIGNCLPGRGSVYLFCWEVNQFEPLQDKSLTYLWFLIAYLHVTATPTEFGFPLKIWRNLDSTNSYKRGDTRALLLVVLWQAQINIPWHSQVRQYFVKMFIWKRKYFI